MGLRRILEKHSIFENDENDIENQRNKAISKRLPNLKSKSRLYQTKI